VKDVTGVKTARIPVIIRDRKLQPFDLVITETSGVLPLSEQRLRQTLFRPESFDMVAESPGSTSLIGQLYPPFRQNTMVGGHISGDPDLMTSGVKVAHQQFENFISDDSNFKAWDGQTYETAGIAEQRRKVKATGNLEDGGAWDQVLSDEHKQNMGLAKQASVSKVEDPGVKQPITGQRPTGFKPKYKGLMGPGGGIKKTASILPIILPTISADDYTRLVEGMDDAVKIAFMKNEGAKDALTTLSGYEPTKVASVVPFIKPTVIQISKTDDGYRIKTASNKMWDPKAIVVDRGELYRQVGSKLAMAVDTEGSVTIADKSAVQDDGPEADKPEPIEEFGLWKVQTTDGKKVIGYAFPNLIDVDGGTLPMVLFTNGAASSLQGDMVGVKVDTGAHVLEGEPEGYGAFVRVRPNGKAEAMIPMDIKTEVQEGDEKYCLGETFDGKQVKVKKQPNIQLPHMVDEVVLIPDEFRWMPLKGQSLQIVDATDAFDKKADGIRQLLQVQVRGGNHNFSIDGHPVEKLAHDQKNNLDIDGAMFLLAGLGVSPKYSSKKLAEANHVSRPVNIRIGRSIKTAASRYREAIKTAVARTGMFPIPKPLLVKEAAAISDPMAVDTVLSIGFVNPENISSFISYLPSLEEGQKRMCELLLGARLGMKEVPKEALERAIKATEQVLDGLKVLAFQEN
jgi:hypothetical protein